MIRIAVHRCVNRTPQFRLVLIGMLAGMAIQFATAQESEPILLSIRQDPARGWIRLFSSGPTGLIYQIQSSSNFSDWKELALTHDAVVDYPDLAWPQSQHRFYRVLTSPIRSTNDWKNQIGFPQDAFRSQPQTFQPDEILWIKFAVLLSDPFRVVYQQSGTYPFHYDFARLRLAPFLGASRTQFDQWTLHLDDQRAILGTVLFPPPPNAAEFGIQIVGLDPYPRETIRDVFRLVQATVVTDPGVRAFYLPTFEQFRSAETNRDYFASQGIEITSTSRWLPGNQCYAAGWALGPLKFFPGDAIRQAYLDGLLQPTDILLTDGVPAEIPFVAGIISLTPSTPNSHVAILARSFGVPFVHLVNPQDQARAHQWVGRTVALRASVLFDRSEIRLIDPEPDLTPEFTQEILDLKRPTPLIVTPKAAFGALSVSAEALSPADLRFVGGKAANYGLLRDRVPSHAPVAIAFTFDLWDQFMNQTMPGGASLRQIISNRLSGYVYPPDFNALVSDLDDIQDLIEDTAVFNSNQQNAILGALGVFDPTRKIRFRSSTNVEDTDTFVGAGLYDSYSGCLLDDLDGDTLGPSLCDPTEQNERGVFRAIKKVYASFYNDNAFLERLRLGVDESQVGMGVLVHHSFPDEDEWANGVATLEVTGSGPSLQMNGDLVTQKGAVPVTNPDGSALPEIIGASRYSFGTFFNFQQGSSLVPLGGYVLDWDAEYRSFMNLFADVAAGYKAAFPAKSRFLLDFEYKKQAPGDLIVKQVRELPLPNPAETISAFLLNQSNHFTVFQGEAADVFSNHRLKSRWSLQTRNLRLAPPNLQQSIYTQARWEHIDHAALVVQTGPPSSWNQASNAVSGEILSDYWTLGPVSDREAYTLETTFQSRVPASEPPLFTLDDFSLHLRVRYAKPQPALDYFGTPVSVSEELVRLVPPPVLTASSLRQERDYTYQGITVHIVFYWPEPPRGAIAGYTAPLVQWEETRIAGLTTAPILLRDYYAQTYRPGHHNFTEEFIFEPRLEPGLSPALLSELQAANVRLIHVVLGQLNAPITLLGLDGKFRISK